jgi:hypothetical protein
LSVLERDAIKLGFLTYGQGQLWEYPRWVKIRQYQWFSSHASLFPDADALMIR